MILKEIVKQFEYWLRHYYKHSIEACEKDIDKIKSAMSKDISDNKRWAIRFSCKHKNAQNKYKKAIEFTHEKERSDFPSFFRSLKELFDTDIVTILIIDHPAQ